MLLPFVATKLTGFLIIGIPFLASDFPSCSERPIVISGDDAGDQIVESPDVKVSVGKAKAESAPTREASKSTGCSESEP
jgi:hypothetical protein